MPAASGAGLSLYGMAHGGISPLYIRCGCDTLLSGGAVLTAPPDSRRSQ